MTTVNGTNKIAFNEVLNGLNAVGNFLQQSGITGSIWTVENPQNTPTNPTGTQETPNTPASTPAKTNDEIKEEIVNLLNNNEKVNVNFKSDQGKEVLNDLVKKYNAIKTMNPNISDIDLSDRLANYINGYLYHCREHQFGIQNLAESIGIEAPAASNEIINEDVDKANKSNDMNAFISAFHQQAKEYIEFYDGKNENGRMDGLIDFEELYNIEVAETIELLGEDLSPEEISEIKDEIYIKVAQRIAYCNFNDDDVLDENEIAGYLWARNAWKGDGAKLTYEEYKDFENALAGNLGMTEKQINQARACRLVLENHGLKVTLLPDDLSTLGLSDEELNIVKNGVEPLKSMTAITTIENGYNGLKNL